MNIPTEISAPTTSSISDASKPPLPVVVSGAMPAKPAQKKPLIIKVDQKLYAPAPPVLDADASALTAPTISAPTPTIAAPVLTVNSTPIAAPAADSAAMVKPAAAKVASTAPVSSAPISAAASKAAVVPVAVAKPAPVEATATMALKTEPLFTTTAPKAVIPFAQAAPVISPVSSAPALATAAPATLPSATIATITKTTNIAQALTVAAPAGVARGAPILVQQNQPAFMTPTPVPSTGNTSTATVDQSSTHPGVSAVAQPATTQIFKPTNPNPAENKAAKVESQEAPVDFDEKQAIAFLQNIAGSQKILLNLDSYAADIMDPVHIDEAVAFALKNNFEVLASKQKSRGAYWDKVGGYSEYGPAVELDADSGHERSQPAAVQDDFGNRILDNTHNRRDHDIVVRQPLVDLSLITDILSARDKEDVAKDEQLDTREGVAFDTVSTYLSLLEARLTVQLADNYKHYLEDLEARMKIRVQGGAATDADLQRIRGRATAAEAVRIEALGTYTTQMTTLRRLMRMTPKILVVPNVLTPSVPGDAQDAVQEAMRLNPSYLSTLKKVDLAKDDRDKSLAAFSPRLSFEYSNTYSFNADGGAEGSPLNGAFPTQKDQQIMLVAQFSLNGGTAAAGTMSGAAKVSEMKYRVEDARSRLEEGIVSSYTAINAAKYRSNALAKNVEANQKVMAGFETQFNNGSRSLFDLLDAYEQFYNSQLNLLRVTIARAKASYQVRRMMGELASSIIGAERK